MDTTFNTITNAKEVVDNIRKEIEAARVTHICTAPGFLDTSFS